MSAYLLFAFVILFSVFTLTTGISHTFLAKKEKNEKELNEAKKYQDAKEQILEARKNFKLVNNRDSISIDELVSGGLLPTNFKISKYGKDFAIIGNEIILNVDINNMKDFKYQLDASKKEALQTIVEVNDTKNLAEQQKKFNTLKSNEKSITIGNDVTLRKSSEDFKN